MCSLLYFLIKFVYVWYFCYVLIEFTSGIVQNIEDCLRIFNDESSLFTSDGFLLCSPNCKELPLIYRFISG